MVANKKAARKAAAAAAATPAPAAATPRGVSDDELMAEMEAAIRS
jgi:hypothetical protein